MNLKPLYTKTATGAVQVWKCWVEGDTIHTEWGQEDGQSQSSAFVCLPKNQGRSNYTTAEQQAVKEAEALWKKQIKKKYQESREECLSFVSTKPMLAKSMKDQMSKVKFPVTIQPKLDGVRCLAYNKNGTVFLQSRGGEEYLMTHITKELEGRIPEGMALDGELYSHGTALQTLNSWVRKPQDASVNVKLHVYDYTLMKEAKVTWEKRSQELAAWFKKNSDSVYIELTPNLTATSHAEIDEAHATFTAEGYEGAIVRLPKGLYKFGRRSSDLLKVKSFQDAEFKIVGWNRSKPRIAKDSQTQRVLEFPVFRCVTKAGNEFDCLPKGTEEERIAMLEEADKYVGQLLKVQYFALTQDGVPQFPVGLAIRDKADL